MAKWIEPVRYDGKRYAPGDDCPVEDAKILSSLSVQGLIDGGADQEDASIADVIRVMTQEDPDRSNEAWWTKAGKPEVSAIRDRLGRDVSAAERDEVWAVVNTD